MRYPFFTIKNFKKLLLTIGIIICLCTGLLSGAIVYSQSKTYTYRVVIDAGHGGIDGGSEGFNGTKESEINLVYAKTLQQYFKDFGFKTTMTRTNENGL